MKEDIKKVCNDVHKSIPFIDLKLQQSKIRGRLE